MNAHAQHAGEAGSTLANWVAVADHLPAQAVPVLIAYRFMDDDELTVDMGERDGARWMYLGGGLIEEGDVFFWCFPPGTPAVPGVARAAAPNRLMELAA